MKLKIDWKNHLVEFVLITLGVLIAFGLNAWYESRQERKQTRLYLEGIVDELKTNRAELAEKHAYHEELLQRLIDSTEKAVLILRPPNVSNVAWELSENPTFKSHIDHEVYKKLAEIYQLHETLIVYVQSASGMMVEANLMGPYHLAQWATQEIDEEAEQDFLMARKRGWIPVFETWTFMEGSYVKKVDEVLEDIEK